MSKLTRKKIAVIGSINMDLVTATKKVPQVGETVLGESFQTTPGGKGANQAVAASRLGADVTLIGCLGNDTFGRELPDYLRNQGINTDYIKTVPDVSTGIASITLSEGDNSIIVVQGANKFVTPEMVEEHESVIANSDILLLQLEIPLESVEKAVEIAKRNQVNIVLNPAPVQPLSKDLLQKVDYLTPNEHEQDVLLSSNEWTDKERKELLEKCIVTKGSKGVTFFQNGERNIESFRVNVVDTTGAGDTFNGALAFSLCSGANLEAACQFANAAGALSVTKLGAQSGMPKLEEVNEFLEQRRG